MSHKENMRGIRVLRGMTRAQVAEKVGVTPQTIGKYERGEIEPRQDMLVALSRLYDVSLDQIAGVSDVISPK